MVQELTAVQTHNLSSDASVRHGFFGRKGGVSEGIYNSLNCGPGSDDDAMMVQENRKRVANYFGQSAESLASVWQIHSPDCLVINQIPASGEARPKADAMVTDKPNIILGVLTADCGPILLTGQKPDGLPIIGAAHSGWRGAIGGVLESTVKTLCDLGADINTIRAAVGPCIGPASYEVGNSFIDPFIKQDEGNEHFFKDGQKDGHMMFDLPGYIAARLNKAGVTNVEITGQDTFADGENYFSYRRTTHANEPDYGRQISAIMIEG